MPVIVVYGPPAKRPRYMTPERESYLREWHFLDDAILAHDIKLCLQFTRKYLRMLGLRTCSHTH